MSYLLAFAGFAALIVLHEFGHFLAAKAVGMRVERFSLFFGPMIVKRRRGETVYGIGTIPLGGYVKITGMNPQEEIPAEVAPRAYYRQPVWKRITVILAGPAVNLVIAFVMLTAIVASTGYVDQSVSQIAAVQPHEPAVGHLRGGDRIVSIDGRAHLSADAITRGISSHACAGAPAAGCRAATPVRLVVQRAGREVPVTLYPRYDPATKRMRLGIQIQSGVVRGAGLGTAAAKSLGQMWYVTHKTVTTIVTIFEPKVRSQIHGVVGGFDVTQQRFSYDTTEALYTLAIISLSLAVINLFPFLPLDGGHVFWAVAEKVRGRAIPFAVMERAGAVGFVLIIMLFVIGFSNDISTLTGRGFNVR
jgi:regulator of sigma E protease